MASVDYAALSATAKKGFEPLPVGEYDVEVTNAEYKTASTGSPMYKIEFTIEAGPHKGRKLWRNLTLKVEKPNAVGAFFGQMRALGLNDEFFASSPEEATICAELIGNRARVTVKHREYNGQTQNDVDKIVSRAGSSTPSVPTTAAAAPSRQGPPDLPPGL